MKPYTPMHINHIVIVCNLAMLVASLNTLQTSILFYRNDQFSHRRSRLGNMDANNASWGV